MFVVSMKANRGLLIAVAAIGVALAMLLTQCGESAPTSAAVSGVPAACLRQLGYEAESHWTDLREVTLPTALDEEWTAYNGIQQAAGYDLTPYLGQRVKRYTYGVQTSDGPATATLYVAGGLVIAGDISVNGETHGLIPQQQGETDGTTG